LLRISESTLEKGRIEANDPEELRKDWTIICRIKWIYDLVWIRPQFISNIRELPWDIENNTPFVLIGNNIFRIQQWLSSKLFSNLHVPTKDICLYKFNQVRRPKTNSLEERDQRMNPRKDTHSECKFEVVNFIFFGYILQFMHGNFVWNKSVKLKEDWIVG
jgi:hypothetical protein